MQRCFKKISGTGRRSGVYIANFEHILHLFLVLLSLTLDKYGIFRKMHQFIYRKLWKKWIKPLDLLGQVFWFISHLVQVNHLALIFGIWDIVGFGYGNKGINVLPHFTTSLLRFVLKSVKYGKQT